MDANGVLASAFDEDTGALRVTLDADSPDLEATYQQLGPVRSLFDPNTAITTASAGAANRATYLKAWGWGTISKIAVEVAVQSGNICLAVYSGDGAGGAPGTRRATTGSVACPAVGYAEVALGGSVLVGPGDYLCFTADNSTATFRAVSGSASGGSAIFAGFCYFEASAFPAPATATPSVSIHRPYLLVGVA